jgi:hypothetical protein
VIGVAADRFRPDISSFTERDLDLISRDDAMKWAWLQRRD